MLDNVMQDLRHALRALRSSPGFTAVAILTLGLGIGANAAIFSVINATLLRPLPYHEQARLVTVQHHYPSFDMDAPVSVPGFRDYQAQTALFERAAVQTGWQPNLTGDGEPERLTATRVTGDFFVVYGVAPALGRALRPDEAQQGADHVVVLSDRFWRRKMAADSGVVGRRLQLNGESYEIVGVMPASFRDFWNRGVELWAPLAFRPDQYADGNRTNEFLNFSGRLAAGVTAERAAADMQALAGRLKTQYPDNYASEWDLKLTPLFDIATQNVRRGLIVLLGAVGLVLLIACANVANLQLARASARARELAVRVALGAAPGRLMRYMLTESVVLALAGGVLGLLLAVWGVPALLALNNRNLPPAEEIGVDLAVLGFTLTVSLLTGLIFGIVPAARVMKADLHGTLKEGGRGNTDRGGLALRRALVVTTVAVALTLLTGAGLLIKSFARLLAVDPGFASERLLTFNIALPSARYSNDTVRVATLERLVSAVRATPGVTAAGGTQVMPFGPGWSTGSFNIEGYQVAQDQNGPWGDQRIVTPDFLPTLGADLISGRQFTALDRAGAPLVAIVDEEMVRRYWPGQDPIGKRLTFNNLTDSNITWITVVGVVRHTMHEGLDGQVRVQMYRPLAQVPLGFMAFAVRAAGDPMAVLPSVRAAIRQVDDQLPISAVSTMEDMIDATAGPRRFAMILLGSFAALALVLASIGLYGVMSYTVTQRTQELGVRVALGAGTRDVLRLVLGDGMRLVAIGVAIGMAAAFGLTRLMRSMLFETPPTDLVTFAVIPLVLLAVALLASYVPARRAARVDPMTALRAE